MAFVIVPINISADDYLANYTGTVHSVLAKSTDGRTVQFPAILLRRFVTQQGIRGVFKLYYDSRGKFTRIERLK